MYLLNLQVPFGITAYYINNSLYDNQRLYHKHASFRYFHGLKVAVFHRYPFFYKAFMHRRAIALHYACALFLRADIQKNAYIKVLPKVRMHTIAALHHRYRGKRHAKLIGKRTAAAGIPSA